MTKKEYLEFCWDMLTNKVRCAEDNGLLCHKCDSKVSCVVRIKVSNDLFCMCKKCFLGLGGEDEYK